MLGLSLQGDALLFGGWDAVFMDGANAVL
jgi:hypothetical protein